MGKSYPKGRKSHRPSPGRGKTAFTSASETVSLQTRDGRARANSSRRAHAEGTKGRDEASGRDRGCRDGGANRDWRDRRQPKIASYQKWPCGIKSPRSKLVTGTAVRDRKTRSRIALEDRQMTDAGPSFEDIQRRQNLQAAQIAVQGGSPRFYANNIATAQTLSDIALVMMTNDVPVCVINMPYPVAKTLRDALTILIDKFENLTDTKIKSLEEQLPEMRKLMSNT